METSTSQPSSSTAAEPNQEAVVTASATAGLFRKRQRGGNLRKKGDDDSDDGGGGVVRKQRQVTGEPLAFSTKREDKEDVGLKYEGSKAIQSGRDEMVTRANEIETALDHDARAIKERQMVLSKAVMDGAAQDDGKYKGMSSYIDYKQGFRRETNVSSAKSTGTHGPLRGSAYMRVSARFDYQPDICKDYKETGFCSYGDSCKFLHDRGDYKSGWELEKVWEEEQKRKAEEKLLRSMRAAEAGDDDEEEAEGRGAGGGAEAAEDELPFACFLCRLAWEECKTGPVVTRCRHYFCEACALKHNAKTGKCAVCEQSTGGTFNVAHDVVKRMNKAKRA